MDEPPRTPLKEENQMGLRINQNIAAQNAYRNLSVTDSQMGKSLEKLSSGFRINRAADDAAGLAISEGLRSQVGGLKQASRNAQDGVSVVQTAEGALTEVHSMLQRVRDLSVQGANSGAQNTESLAAIQAEITQLGEAITDIATRTNFNGTDLLTTAASGTPLTFHVGAGSADTLNVALVDAEAVGTAVTALTAGTAADIDTIDGLIEDVSAGRAGLGASQNRLEHTIASINVSIENLSASESRIRDTDMAQEMMSFTRSQILSQAGTAMLAQANQSQQGVLSLLR
jgi:flagellin